LDVMNQYLLEAPSQSAQPVKYPSPGRFLVSLAILTFLAEMVAMVVLYRPQIPDYASYSLLDGFIMIALILPGLYFLQLKPLLKQTRERTRAEQALRTSEGQLRQANELLERFFFSIDTLIAYVDRDFNFIQVNETYARAGGHPPEFFTGRNHFDLYPNEENQAIFQRVVETGEPFSVFEKPFEYAEYPERGVTYWDWSLQPVKGQNGTVEGAVLSMVDVTDRKHAEDKLARQNEELREISKAERRQRQLAEGLVQATMAVNESLELDQVLGSILEQIRKAIPFGGADIILLDGKSVRVTASLGFEGYPEAIPALERIHACDNFALIQQVRSSLQPVVIDSVRTHPGWKLISGLEWVRSYVAVPLIFGGEVIGIINLNSQLQAAFTQKAVDRLVAFAAPAALALHNARLYEAESRARRVAETLSDAAQALTQTLDLDQVIDTLLDHVHGIVQADTAGVTLLEDEAGPAVRALHGYGQWAARENLPRLPMGDPAGSLTHRLISGRKSLIIPHATSWPAPEARPHPDEIRYWLVVPILASDKVIGFVELGKSGEEAISPENVRWVEALAGQAAIAIQNAWLFEQVRSSRERLQSLARGLVEVQERERYHIARELHDEAGQVLSTLKISLGRLEQEPDCPQRVRQRLGELKGLADGVLEELHRLARDLRPVALDHLGLVAALEQVVKNLNSEQLSVQFKVVGFEELRLSQDVTTSLYRIVQEALTNVVRYAQARNVGILLEWSMDKVKVFVEDDGVGFEPGRVEEGDHLGLIGMRERAEMLGGSLTIESAPGMGTSVIVEVPHVDSDPYRG